MQNTLQALILQATGAKECHKRERVQRLWDGYGELLRYDITGTHRDSVMVKHVTFMKPLHRPKNTVSHQRKIRSYEIETIWYQQWSNFCDDACRVPVCLAADTSREGRVLILEDLDAAGFPLRRVSAKQHELHACLQWLANFHATFMGKHPKGLWPTGSYWHLATRPDELKALKDTRLKHLAAHIDRTLSASPYQTLVHGDAKLENFCFSPDGHRVAAVDFQYVGGGCGIKDVAYLLDSCLSAAECERQELELLDSYFHALKQALQHRQSTVDVDALEADWRALYPFAWADFYRFLKGWSPGYGDHNPYAERMTRSVIAQLHP